LTTFAPLFVPDALRESVGDAAWLAAMLDVERALARASSAAGIVPADAAEAIGAACVPERYDIAELCREGRSVGNPAEPLVRALRAQVAGDASRWVHVGATSQDVLDSAAMLVARNALVLVRADLDGLAGACARLAADHRHTAAAARTLLQQAVPTTFGLRAAGWLVGVLDARQAAAAVVLPAQLGGAAGTLAVFGERGVEVVDRFAAELGLAAPALPWHTRRAPVSRLAGALEEVAAACSKIALDVVLLAQTEIAEVSESGGGGSSTMPHKRNPAQAVLARACARGVHAHAAVLTTGDHELERAAGAWQAEWPALSGALALAGGAAAATRASLEALEPDPERMRANRTIAVFAERDALTERGVLVEPDETYLGSAATFVDRALARWEEER
jgi:3-carboxy-cis,cis-muconate cycloisomerase